jgi:hypothetical protein
MEGWQVAQLLEMLIVSGAVVGSLGIIAWAWVKRRPHAASGDISGLTDSVETLRESVEAMRAELGDVSDRLDFTERMLARVVDNPQGAQKELPGGR